MKITVENHKEILKKAIEKLEEEKEADYFMNAPGVGFVRIRKTGKISFQLFGLGIAKPKLQARIEMAETNTPMDIDLIQGEYNLEMIDKLSKSVSITDGEKVEQPEKKDKKKKSKKGDTKEEKRETGRVKVKQLEKEYEKKAVKKAVAGILDKKIAKAVAKGIESTIDGYGVINLLDKAAGGPTTSDKIEKLFSLLK